MPAIHPQFVDRMFSRPRTCSVNKHPAYPFNSVTAAVVSTAFGETNNESYRYLIII